jgi:hypothetical protein
VTDYRWEMDDYWHGRWWPLICFCCLPTPLCQSLFIIALGFDFRLLLRKLIFTDSIHHRAIFWHTYILFNGWSLFYKFTYTLMPTACQKNCLQAFKLSSVNYFHSLFQSIFNLNSPSSFHQTFVFNLVVLLLGYVVIICVFMYGWRRPW